MRTLSQPDRSTNLTVGFIPARWHSSRFPGKPLELINGVPMLQRVYDRAKMCKNLDTVVILTDDNRIRQYCAINEIRCIVVEDECYTGTDRCASALSLCDGNLFVNIQGDEPLINPDAIDHLIEEHDSNVGVSNAYVNVTDDYKLHDKNVVKVVTDLNSNAVYYSRLPIPYLQKLEVTFKQQLGLYVFNRPMLELFPSLLIGTNERAESVEMLRFIENGYAVRMVEVDDQGLSVDTPEDLKRVEKFLNEFN
tara:strand:- start:1312 stop:2064 length:753 start_codon:yes stop_codon:yes gene_type:complete